MLSFVTNVYHVAPLYILDWTKFQFQFLIISPYLLLHVPSPIFPFKYIPKHPWVLSGFAPKPLGQSWKLIFGIPFHHWFINSYISISKQGPQVLWPIFLPINQIEFHIFLFMGTSFNLNPKNPSPEGKTGFIVLNVILFPFFHSIIPGSVI